MSDIKFLYTSYIAKVFRHPDAHAITVRRPPKFTGVHFPALAPLPAALSLYKEGKIDDARYTEIYLRTLRNRGRTPQQVADMLPQGAILMCYEGPDKFCHRHVAAQWLRDGANVDIKELP